MRILVAEDDPQQRLYFESLLRGWGDEVVPAEEGLSALRLLLEDKSIRVALIDSLMPGLDGPMVCREFRRRETGRPVHLILLTVRVSAASAVRGLDAGADDYVRKPVDPEELHARVRAGARTVELRETLADRVRDLEAALGEVQRLQELLPICGYCSKVRDDKDYWQKVEVYLAQRTGARLTHGVCPDCYARVVEPQLRRLEGKGE